MKEFSLKEVVILVFATVSGIAFLETSGPVWTWAFGREFLLKLLVYCSVSVVIAIVLTVLTGKHD